MNSSDWCVCIIYDTTSFVFSMYTFIVNNYIFISGKVTYRIVCWYGWGLLYVTPALRVVSLAWPRREGEIGLLFIKEEQWSDISLIWTWYDSGGAKKTQFWRRVEIQVGGGGDILGQPSLNM